MTWTYSVDQINTKPLYRVRYMIGDNVCAEQQFQDEEILAAIGARGSLVGACADLCRALATKYSRSVDTSALSSKATFSQLSKQYNRQAGLYETKAAARAMPYFGGISLADKLQQELDQDRVPPLFQRGMHDNTSQIAPVGIESEEISGD